ncbi:Nitrogen regulation protein NR(I) [uncultured Desulfobacterium sp.]|uniref:DNA-binding transcriptional regulator NtrC n=1 Tax=uncultured Desulfobacterium sp. TaxID=201089 RepID=A0A445N0X7_9BACT|nr:Nitrogen regulation protein NR(I) [uncultured Desulfobacterium sp.]
MNKILVIDDEQMIRFAFEQFLKDEGHMPLLAQDADVGLDLIHNDQPDIVFLDYRLGAGKDGLDLLKELRKDAPAIPVVFMTAFGAMDVAIKAMQLGAYEYLTKPIDLDKVRQLIQRILAGKRSIEMAETNASSRDYILTSGQMVGKGPAMQDIFKMIGLLTTQNITVLITGESGVGKELVARAIHDNSPKSNKPFVAVNCGAMPENLLEAEMFGYEKGAFTGADTQRQGKFEVADGGTIFLDEIGDLQFSLQVKLLRVLQERTFERIGGNKSVQTEARIIAATNKNLQEEVSTGRFRRDLFYRLHLIHVHLPPLRERREDVPELIRYFISKSNMDMAKHVKGVTEDAMKHLIAYDWPGNVRELENQIKRAMILSRDDVLAEHLFDLRADVDRPVDMTSLQRLEGITRLFFTDFLTSPSIGVSIFDQAVGAVEKTLIHEALRQTRGNQMHAAQLLGIHRSTLRKKIKDYSA